MLELGWLALGALLPTASTYGYDVGSYRFPVGGSKGQWRGSPAVGAPTSYMYYVPVGPTVFSHAIDHDDRSPTGTAVRYHP